MAVDAAPKTTVNATAGSHHRAVCRNGLINMISNSLSPSWDEYAFSFDPPDERLKAGFRRPRLLLHHDERKASSRIVSSLRPERRSEGTIHPAVKSLMAGSGSADRADSLRSERHRIGRADPH